MVKGIRILNNHAERGGGLYINGSGNQAQLGGAVRVEDNSATHGGGLWAGNFATLSLDPGVQIRNNDATGSGGGIAAVSGASVSMGGIQVRDNSASRGGGIYLSAADLDARADGSPGEIIGNSASSAGGGIYLVNEGTEALFLNYHVDANEAFELGGGRRSGSGPSSSWNGATSSTASRLPGAPRSLSTE